MTKTPSTTMARTTTVTICGKNPTTSKRPSQSLDGELAILMRTKKDPKRRRTYIKAPNCRDGQNDGDGKKRDTTFHLRPPASEHDECNDHRTQSHYPIDDEHGEGERHRTGGMHNFGEYCAGFDFHCGRPVLSDVGKIVPGLFLDRYRGEIDRSGITNCEHGERSGFVRSAFDDESEHREIVKIERRCILADCCRPMSHNEGNQVKGTSEKESHVKPIEVWTLKILP